MPADQGPFFFLSYAHTPRQDPDDPRDPDKWVVDFFNDLCADVMQLTNLPHGARAGFMDRELRSGSDWPHRLAEALATCRVFVPLYSGRYFDSELCGKEWFAFSRRVLNHTARGTGSTEAIIPALWVPVTWTALPQAARTIQFDHSAFGERYGTHGFYGIIKLQRFRSDYEVAVYELARRIVEVAERTRLEPTTPADYESLDSAFGQRDRDRPGDRRMRLTVVAPSATDLPDGRGPFHYGPTARDWNPYRPESARPLVDHAADLIRNLDHRPDVGTFEEHVDDLLDDGPPTEPGLLLLDAWATLDPQRLDLLRQFDTLSKPWISLLVSWNRLDPETAEAEHKLRQSLHLALEHKLAESRLAARVAVNGIHSLEDFGLKLPAVVRAATRQYLKHAEAHPPAGGGIERPRLAGPTTPADLPEDPDDRRP